MGDRQFENAIVRIRSADGAKLCGAGALVTKRTAATGETEWFVLTCAHVVAQALGASDSERNDIMFSPTPPTRQLSVDFPIPAAGRLISARVHEDYWRPAVEYDKTAEADVPRARDIAILKLLDTPPGECEPIPVTRNRNQGAHFLAFGVPRGMDRGTYARGDVLGGVAHGDIEIGVTDISNRKNFVTRGFSGSPAWHSEHEAMFGMVAEVKGETQAYVRPLESLSEVWDAFEVVDDGDEPPAPQPQPAALPSIHLPQKIPYDNLLSIDRIDQEREMREVLDGMPSQPVHRPKLFLLPGAFEENAEELVPYFARTLLPPYGMTAGSPSLEDFPWVPWSNPETGSIEARTQELMHNLCETLGAASPDEHGVRAALQDPDNINVLGWLVPTQSLDRPGAELVDRWFQVWNQVAGQGLTRAVAVFLCFVHYEDPPLGIDVVEEFVDGRTWNQLPSIDVHALPALDAIPVDFVRTWCEQVLPGAAGVRRRGLPRLTASVSESMPCDPVSWTRFYETLEELKMIVPEN